ncbi:hypothetical protein [Adhaeribacter radiodurans]|nr:hypothetical protein [Adhaeribacter radiodurans]
MAGGPRLALPGGSKLPFLLRRNAAHQNLRRTSAAKLVSVFIAT